MLKAYRYCICSA